MVDHFGLVVSDLTKAQAFFDACLAPLNAKRAVNFPGASLYANGKGIFFQIVQKEGGSKYQEGAHYAFASESTKEVDAWYDAAIKAGAKDNGKPGPRPNYGPHFYGAFVHDPIDGHHLECCFKHYNAEETKKDGEHKAPQLYYWFGTRAMRPIWMAEEIGIKLDLHAVDLTKVQQKTDDYIKINPYGTVPTLVDGEDVMSNSVSSTVYLSRKYGGDKFTSKRLDALEFISSIDRFDDLIIRAYLNKIIYPAEKRDANVVTNNHATFVKQVLPHWDRIASKMGGQYALGDQFTAVDVVWGYLLNLVVQMEWITEKEHPVLFEYTARLRARPAFKSVYDRSNKMYVPKTA